MQIQKRFLPILEGDGNWIERADLYLLSRMAYEDSVEDEVVDQLYGTMLRSEKTSPQLNVLEADLEKRHLRRNLRARLLAGQVVLELCRIAGTIGKPPSVKAAIRICAQNQLAHQRKSTFETLVREVEKGFSSYRSTAHLQAAVVLGDPAVDEMEGDLQNMKNFLARARALELFIDSNVAHDGLNWSPWRVPATVKPNCTIEFQRLTEREIALIGSN